MREHHIPVTRTARYYTLGKEQGRPRQVWFVCHGYGQLAADFVGGFSALDDGDRLIVAPEALNRFYLESPERPHTASDKIGATWMTREDRLTEIDDYVRYLDALHAHILGSADRPTADVRVLGFSQGAATAARWMAFGSAEVTEVILWGSFPPHDLDLESVRRSLGRQRLTLVVGTRDRYASAAVASEHQARLQAHGVDCRVVTFEGGHRLDDETLRRLAADIGPS